MTWKAFFFASGEQFKPSQIKYAFTTAQDSGIIEKSGRYAGKPRPFGSISIEFPARISQEKIIAYIVKIVQPLLPKLREAGADDMYVAVTRYYATQCNEAFSHEELTLLASLGCSFWYSASMVSEEEESALEKRQKDAKRRKNIYNREAARLRRRW
jgi:hypothetical protein